MAMNFFVQQERARSHTKRMLFLFALAVICIVGAIDMLAYFALNMGDHSNSMHHVESPAASGLLWISIIVLAVIFFSSLYKISSLRGGGGAVAQQLGAVQVQANSPDFAHKRLRNVVEEMAIASGVPVPEIYILEDENAINAFAAGYTPSDAAVTVTRGAMNKLTRDELQGVIAHEFSHVLNGDMRLNIRMMGVLFGILVIGIVGRKMFENGGRSRDSNSVAAIGLAIFVIGYIGVFFGRVIKAGISRQREYLADASAVQFTRQPTGIGGALKKIGALAEGSQLQTSDKEEVAHMLFGDGVGYSAMFATHPPLDLRIKAIDPQFDPRELAQIAAAWQEPVSVGEEESAQVSISGFAPAAAAAVATRATASSPLPQATATMKIDASQISQRGTEPTKDDIANAGAIRTSIPEHLRIAAHMPSGASQVIFALTLDADATRREQQLALIQKYFDADTRNGTEQLAGEMAQLHPLQRLPLAQLAFPSLRRLPRPQLQTFLIVLNQLAQTQGEGAIEDYCLAKLIAVQVVDALNPSKAQPNGSLKLPTCASELVDVFTVIAEYGSDNPADAERAYLLGMNEVLTDAIPPYREQKEWQLALDRALPKLDQLMPAAKELLVRGLTKAISADGVVTVVEAELLRTICAAVHCPLPPIMDQAA